jgi:adenylate cyclase
VPGDCEHLLELYLGASAARHVLAGQVERGRGELIHAAVLYSDLRGFTSMTERFPPVAVIATLNDYFECATAAVHDDGGEVLKLIGDGMLAAFNMDGKNPTDACCQALDASSQILGCLERLTDPGGERLTVGIALHRGDVVYGNIGGPQRLDFTVIGRAVNEAIRVEGLCRRLDESVLASSAFATSCACRSFTSLGRHTLHGVAEPQEIFAPVAETLHSLCSP